MSVRPADRYGAAAGGASSVAAPPPAPDTAPARSPAPRPRSPASHIPQLVRGIGPQDGQHPIEQVGRAGTDRLIVMLAPLHHLRVIERRDLRVPLPRAF